MIWRLQPIFNAPERAARKHKNKDRGRRRVGLGGSRAHSPKEEGMATNCREPKGAARRRAKLSKLFIATGAAIAALYGPHALAVAPVTACSSAGIGSVTLVADGPPV